MPAGSPDGGQWTSGGEGIGSSSRDLSDDPNVLLVADNDPQRRYSVNLEEEDKRGGHGHRDHVGKTDKYLLDVLDENWSKRRIGLFEVITYREAQGSFRSSEEANDFVSQTLRAHQATVEKVASGQFSDATLEERFGYTTGKEAFRPSGESKPYIRNTYGVRVIIRHDPHSPRGYRVHTAFPVNQRPR